MLSTKAAPTFSSPPICIYPKNIAYPAPAIVITAGHAMETGKKFAYLSDGATWTGTPGLHCLRYRSYRTGESVLYPAWGITLAMAPSSSDARMKAISFGTPYVRWIMLLPVKRSIRNVSVWLATLVGAECVFYTMPFEERFAAAGSFSFVCSYDQWIRHGGNHCICNHFPQRFPIHGRIRDSRSQRSPSFPLRQRRERQHSSPLLGHAHTRKRAQKIYTFYNAEENLQAAEAPEPHGWSQPLREACYGFMNLHLQNKGDGAHHS